MIVLSAHFLMAAPPHSAPQAPLSGNEIVGFKEWKKNQVFDARKDLDEFKSPQLSKMKEVDGTESVNPGANVENTGDQNLDPDGDVDLEAQGMAEINEKAERLRQLEFHLEIAQGLTIHDYFALYLKNKSKDEMAAAIQKLSPEELSELLMAYRQNLYGLPPVKQAESGTL
jgi:hypothetical protein